MAGFYSVPSCRACPDRWANATGDTVAKLTMTAGVIAGLLALPGLMRPADENPPSTTRLKPRLMEKLGRGLVAIHPGDNKVFISWRLLGTDPDAITFNLYRS